jgi:regulator of sirC expression with transglutaminase-like and TPR domain
MVVGAASASAESQTPADQVREIISAADHTLSYERTKLALDHIIAPDTDDAALIVEIDHLANEAKRIAGNGNDGVKLTALRQVIYDAGPWNGNRPFSYDLQDPLGLNVRHKLLATYLETRLGNCVSMPELQLIIAEKLGLNVALSTAPLHMTLRYVNPNTGRTTLIEATSGGYPARDAWYREKMGVTDEQVKNGIYLGTLTKREAIAHMATTVMEWLMDQHRYQEAIDVADVILQYYPRDVYTVVKRGSAYGELLRTEFSEKYSTPAAIPPSLRPRYVKLAKANADAFAKADGWGWKPPE